MTAKSSALSLFDLASACLGVVRRRAGGSQAEGSRLPGARNRRRLGVNRQQSGGCRLKAGSTFAGSEFVDLNLASPLPLGFSIETGSSAGAD